MVQRRTPDVNTRRKRPPATTPEGREMQLSAMAYDLAERQLADGSASAQVISHFLKASSSRERLEQAKLEMEKELAGAKVDAMKSAKRVEELMSEALRAMKSYTGVEDDTEEYDD